MLQRRGDFGRPANYFLRFVGCLIASGVFTLVNICSDSDVVICAGNSG